VTFDPDTGLIRRLETLRYRDADEGAQEILWRNDVDAWARYGDLLLPSRASVTWEDQGFPWLEISVDEVVYNADVSAYVRARGV
jgi:hypothetical protein